MEKLISVNQLSDVLGLKKITIYEWVRDNKIPFIKLGKRVLFHPSDIEEFIEANRVEGRKH
jgi:excisionase family DNA binding protein|tara:strand:+ start:424 stop:606 length:183 start_codon:yes stop_codon:yes gene_type:complete